MGKTVVFSFRSSLPVKAVFNKIVLLAITLFFCSFANAATPLSIYKCKVNAQSAKGWIPSKFAIGIRNNRAKIKFPKDYDLAPDMNDVRVVRNNKGFKEIFFTIDQKDSENQRQAVNHNITILPASNKVVYVAKFKHFNNHYEARGKCVVEQRSQ